MSPQPATKDLLVITPEERSRWGAFIKLEVSELSHWLKPAAFRKRADHALHELPEHIAFNYNPAKSLREAWVLGRLAKAIDAQAVRLSCADPPDGFVRFAGAEFGVEITEVMEPGRKRGREFRHENNEQRMDPGENWIRRANIVVPQVMQAIVKKSHKVYPDNTILLIYANLSTYGVDRLKIKDGLLRAVETPSPFKSIYVLWDGRIYY